MSGKKKSKKSNSYTDNKECPYSKICRLISDHLDDHGFDNKGNILAKISKCYMENEYKQAGEM